MSGRRDTGAADSAGCTPRTHFQSLWKLLDWMPPCTVFDLFKVFLLVDATAVETAAILAEVARVHALFT